jgi:glucose-6-phosphatase
MLEGLEIPVILFLQTTFSSLDDVLLVLTEYAGNPKYILLFGLPLMELLHVSKPRLGGAYLSAFVTADALNSYLKWPLAGNRPYWFDPRVRQFPVTCETGYGMPSGHSMAVATAYTWAVCRLDRRHRPLAWAFASAVMAVVGWSRVHIGAHFIHQVLSGLAIGVFMGSRPGSFYLRLVMGGGGSSTGKHQQRKYSLLASATMSSFAIVAIFVIEWAFLVYGLGVNPLASVDMAHAGCTVEGGIHHSASPFSGVSRLSGAVFGYGLAHVLLPDQRGPASASGSDDDTEGSLQINTVPSLNIIGMWLLLCTAALMLCDFFGGMFKAGRLVLGDGALVSPLMAFAQYVLLALFISLSARLPRAAGALFALGAIAMVSLF